MKKAIYSVLFFLSLIHFSCDRNNNHVQNSNEITSIFNPTFNKLIDSFLLELAKYDQIDKKTKDTIKLIAYIKIKEASQNNTFKIHLEGILSDSLLNTTTFNDLVIRNNRFVCIDYNISNLIRQNNKPLKDSVIKASSILSYNLAIRDTPSWLVLIEKNQITKVNKNAESCFLNLNIYVGKPVSDEILFYPIDEWGDVYDKKGNKIDSLK